MADSQWTEVGVRVVPKQEPCVVKKEVAKDFTGEHKRQARRLLPGNELSQELDVPKPLFQLVLNRPSLTVRGLVSCDIREICPPMLATGSEGFLVIGAKRIEPRINPDLTVRKK